MTITEQITGDLDFLYKILLEKSKDLQTSGYDACTTGINYDDEATLLSFFFKNKEAILKGELNKQVAISVGEGNYDTKSDYIVMSTETTKTGQLLIIITKDWYNYSFDGCNDDSYWDTETESYLISIV